jgi:hypothetical protein
MGFAFHSYQRKTPETWRPEGPASYTASSLLHIIVAIGLACLLTLMTRFNMAFFSGNFAGYLRFAFCIWGGVVAPIILEKAIFIRLHPLVVLGELLDWLSTSLLAALVTGWWLTR